MVTIIKKVIVKKKISLPTRRSDMATAVAKEVLETIGKGNPVNMRKIVKKHGYSDAVAKNPQQVKRSKSYQEVIDPFLQSMKDARLKAIRRINETIDKASVRDSTDALDKLTKNIQLLEGKATENVASRVIYLPSRGTEEN